MLNIKNDPSLLDKCNILTLCTMFNTKPEHGDIYINCKNLIYLFTNFYIFSTPPLNVLDFPRIYFPFTKNSTSPVLFTTTTIFNNRTPLFDPSNKVLTDLKITSVILTLIYVYLIKNSKTLTHNTLNATFRDPVSFVSHIYMTLSCDTYSATKYEFSNYISQADLDDCCSYMFYIFNSYTRFDSILSKYKETYGVEYDFFRKS